MPPSLEVNDMTGYRSRATKPMVFLWMLIVMVDTGWSVASGTTALVTSFVVGGVLVLLILASRYVFAPRRPVPVTRPTPARATVPARRPSRAPVHRTS
jgi:hypothetical protein